MFAELHVRSDATSHCAAPNRRRSAASSSFCSPRTQRSRTCTRSCRPDRPRPRRARREVKPGAGPLVALTGDAAKRLFSRTHLKGAETARAAAQHGPRLADVQDEAENTTLTLAMLICPWGSSAFHLDFISGDLSPFRRLPSAQGDRHTNYQPLSNNSYARLPPFSRLLCHIIRMFRKQRVCR